MRLISVYTRQDAPKFLYQLLEERSPEVNISHKQLPTWHDHLRFISSSPYQAWYLIDDDTEIVGAIYLTHQREVGLFILKAHRHNGYGPQALAELKRKHPGKLLANVSVHNKDGQKFWENQGFKPLQHTFVWEPANARP